MRRPASETMSKTTIEPKYPNDAPADAPTDAPADAQEAGALHTVMQTAGAVSRPVRRRRGARVDDTLDAIAAEVPVALVYNGTPFAVMMATPGDLADFALGFSLSEGIVARTDE